MYSVTIKYPKTLELIHFQIKIPKRGQTKAKEGRMLPRPLERNPAKLVIYTLCSIYSNLLHHTSFYNEHH